MLYKKYMEFGYIYVYILIVRKSDSMSRQYVYAFVAGRFHSHNRESNLNGCYTVI